MCILEYNIKLFVTVGQDQKFKNNRQAGTVKNMHNFKVTSKNKKVAISIHCDHSMKSHSQKLISS